MKLESFTLRESKLFQEEDARTVERTHLNEILDRDNKAEMFNIV
jgi:hypothetical protein